MRIMQVSAQALQGEPKRMKIPKRRALYPLWNDQAPDLAAPVAMEYTDLVFTPRTDPNGAQCLAAYDADEDILYVCYE